MKLLKKKPVKIGLITCAVLFCMAVVFFKIEEIEDVIVKWKQEIFSISYARIDVPECESFIDEGDEWFCNNRLIAHAGGGMQSIRYSNCKEAFENSVSDGYQIIETDLNLTSDAKIVLKHAWTGGAPTYEQFMSTPIEYKYTPMDVEDLLDFMAENDSVFIVTDIKGANAGKIIERVVELAKEKHCEDVLNQFIIQIYCEDDYDTFRTLYPFSNWIYTLYASEKVDLGKVAKFCLTHDIRVVTIPYSWIQNDKYLSVFKKKNIKVFTHTVNDMETMKLLSKRGVYGFYTDDIKPRDLIDAGIE